MNLAKCFGCIVVLAVSGCQQFGISSLDFPSFISRSQSPDRDSEEDGDEFETKVDTPMIGEYTTVTGLNLITLQGVGLVVGLDGTGGDPPPSVYRQALTDEMRRRGITNPNEILRRRDTAMVVVRAYLPPLIRKGERFDVEVRLPGNSSGATSLSGGRLLETQLTEQAIIPGRGVVEGHVYAKAAGPILISTGEGNHESMAGVLRRGTIVGGGVSLKDRNLALYLREDFRNVRNSKRIADRIGMRFYEYNEYGLRKPLADAKTDKQIELMVHSRYKDNFPRYLASIRKMAFRETEVAQRVRMRRLQDELQNPATSESAALQLEAIGVDAVPMLKTGLKSPTLESRFHSALALAYLSESDGLPALAEAAREERAFRVYALAGMAAVDDVESHILLRELMNEKSAETRYGAFRALSTLDSNDPFIRGDRINDEFWLHVLETDGPAMVHLTKRRKAEIVLFGADQRFKTPIAIRAGQHILVTAPAGGETVTVSRYQVGAPDRKRTISTKVEDVIRTVAEFGASYPDIAQLLAQADKQLNLEGRIEIDALPRAGRVYYRPATQQGGKSETKVRIGSSGLIPNLFEGVQNEDNEKQEPDRAGTPDDANDAPPTGSTSASAEKPGSGTASLADVSEAAGDAGSQAKKDADKDADEESSSADKPPTPKKNRFDILSFFRRAGSDEER